MAGILGFARACNNINDVKVTLLLLQTTSTQKHHMANHLPSKPSQDLSAPDGNARQGTRVLQSDALMYFMKVAYAGSISEAADRLGVAPSAVSRQIAR